MRACKIEIKPAPEQIAQIERTMGVCRYVYNLFISTNRDNFRNGARGYMSGYDFSKWLNNEYRTANPDKHWIWEVSSKAVKKAIMNADRAYKSFMKGTTGFPKFKRRNCKPIGMYLPRNNPADLEAERHRGRIPKLGWVRFKEYGYVPVNARALSVTITRHAGRYYASYLFDAEDEQEHGTKTEGIGIDLGVKTFATLSDGRNYPSINKTNRVRKLIRRLKREQRKFSRKTKTQKGGNCC